MSLIEVILAGIGCKGLEKPFVFFSMLIGFILFIAFGIVTVLAVIETYSEGKELLPSLGLSSFSLLFFGLAALCGYFIKRCFK